jgi:carbon monoxide dehydrogenase subunit G
MALEMNGEYVLPLERAQVYAALNDPDMLKRCIPGCEELQKLSDTEFAAVVRVELGPVKARFKGKVRLEDLDPPNGYRIAGEGEGGVAGFAKGGATVSLSEVPEGTKPAWAARSPKWDSGCWQDRPRRLPTSSSTTLPPRSEARPRLDRGAWPGLNLV